MLSDNITLSNAKSTHHISMQKARIGQKFQKMTRQRSLKENRK